MKINSLLILGCLLLCACTQKMGKIGHPRPFSEGADHASISRIPPDGTIAQNSVPSSLDPTLSSLAPHRLTRQLLKKGKEQFGISCLPCHGPSGHGDGMVVQRGFLAPPSYHIDRLRNAPDQHFVDVITHGYGAMYSYADRVTPKDRWAITAYIRALQLSQNASLDSLPAADQNEIMKGASK